MVSAELAVMDGMGLSPAHLGSLCWATGSRFVDSFCNPRAVAHHFDRELGAFTPCFVDVVLLGEALAHSNSLLGHCRPLSATYYSPATVFCDSRLSAGAGCGTNLCWSCAGIAHLVAILLATGRVAQLYSPTRPRTFRMKGTSRGLQCTAAAATVASLGIVITQASARAFQDMQLFVQGSTAPFEWAGATTACSSAGRWCKLQTMGGLELALEVVAYVLDLSLFVPAGYGLAAVSWVAITAALLSELNRYTPQRSWLLRFPICLILAAQLAKLRCVQSQQLAP